jgi:phosphotransferase system  glucose/maltose/N-acetylglucosamine-specific IIC component
MSTNNINLSMKKNNDQKEYVFAVAAIFFAVLFLVTLFYVKYSNVKNARDSKQKQQEVISFVVHKG